MKIVLGQIKKSLFEHNIPGFQNKGIIQMSEEPKIETKSSKLKWLKSKLPKYPILWMAIVWNITSATVLLNLVGKDLTKEYTTVEPYIDLIGSYGSIVIILIPIVLTIWLLWFFINYAFNEKKRIEIQKRTKESQFQGLNENQRAFIHNTGFFYITLIYNLVVLIGCTVLLVYALLSRVFDSGTLIKDATVIWLGNIISFSVLYWGIDGGGPIIRKLEVSFKTNNFIFPETNLDDKKDWKPNLFDYIYLSFNLASSFSITDHSAVTRSAKAFVIIQAMISFICVGVFIARAINILNV